MSFPGNTMILSFGILILFFGILMAIPVIAVIHHRRKNNVKVRGKCISLIDPSWPEDAPNPPYQPTYEIEYKGQKLKLIRTVGKADGKVELDKYYDLYIDPDNPQNFINPKDDSEHKERVYFMIGCFIGAVAMFIMYLISIA